MEREASCQDCTGANIDFGDYPPLTVFQEVVFWPQYTGACLVSVFLSVFVHIAASWEHCPLWEYLPILSDPNRVSVVA